MGKITKTDKSQNHDLARYIAELTLSKKAEDVTVLNMAAVSAFTDYFIICHGNGELHVKAICDAVEEGLIEKGIKTWHREGYENRKWVLLDYVDVVCHVFDREARSYYRLEDLWGDAEKELIRDETTPLKTEYEDN